MNLERNIPNIQILTRETLKIHFSIQFLTMRKTRLLYSMGKYRRMQNKQLKIFAILSKETGSLSMLTFHTQDFASSSCGILEEL